MIATAGPSGSATTRRLAGEDRYATAAAVSESLFAPDVPAAFIATGEDYPDALAGGPAAARRGAPVLLAGRDVLPDATASELRRLRPSAIVVLGGDNAVSEGVLALLGEFAPGRVERLAGADRYSTAAAISAATFPTGAETVYIASGTNFADALAAAPAAGLSGGPVLLTAADALPAATSEEVRRLRPRSIVVLGGPAAVSPGVEGRLGELGAAVTRIGGRDRYATAVALSVRTFRPGVRMVFLASGSTFPDALAAGSPGGSVPGPLLLVEPSCVPAAVNAEIDRLDPLAIVLLGGLSALDSSTESRTACASSAPAETFGDGVFRVGTDIAPGAYRTRRASPGCSWARLGGLSGSASEVIAGRSGDAHQIAEIAPSDVGFRSTGCGTWTKDLSRLSSSPKDPFGSGTWILDVDVFPATWHAPGGPGCRWERVGAFSGAAQDVRARGSGQTLIYVTFEPGDRGFVTENCGSWVIGPQW